MRIFIFLLITLSASSSENIFTGRFFVVWNIGQGQWTSALHPLHCHHFDMGGEFFPSRKINASCAEKENYLFLSHADWDHINALSKKYIYKKWQKFCLALAPLKVPSERKARLWKSLESCSGLSEDLEWFSPKNAKNSNDQSHVILWKNILLPGDSSKAQEKLWMHKSWLRGTRVLILGHHGSKTSTSEELLEKLPHLKMAISSARWSRYRHPHPSVVQALRKHKVALLRTEDWGNIWIEE